MNNQGIMVDKSKANELIQIQQYQDFQSNDFGNIDGYNVVINSGMMMRKSDVVNENANIPLSSKQIFDNNTIDDRSLDDIEDKELWKTSDSKTVSDQITVKSQTDVREIIRQKQEAVKQQMAVANGGAEFVTNQNAQQPAQQSVVNNAAKSGNVGDMQPVSQTNTNNTVTTHVVTSQTENVKLKMRSVQSIETLVEEYIKLFDKHFGIKLSSAICFENMRKLVDIDVKTPDKSLYFLENTYRISSLLYLTEHLPIIVVASVLAEKNRKNILNYVITEVETSSKRYDDVVELRKKRWKEKYNNMALNDTMTVTPGVTFISNELVELMRKNFDNMCNNLRKFNKELSDIVSRFDESTKNDVVYIYSNWWYLLQGFENEPNMRTYIFTITDDTRKNLKI